MSLAVRWRPSPNHEPRAGGRQPDLLLLHYTGMASAAAAEERLCDPAAKVSSHYLIDEAGGIVQMVEESARAWHAGVAHWQGESDINSCSIGLEIHNPGHGLGYPDFPEAQMRAVVALAGEIVARYAIPAARVLAHSDVAPARKIDPGERFDWPRLARAGLGLWVPPAPPREGPALGRGMAGPAVGELQRRLAALGYGLAETRVYDLATEQVVTAFQRHWRPACVDGRADAATRATLERLLSAGPPAAV